MPNRITLYTMRYNVATNRREIVPVEVTEYPKTYRIDWKSYSGDRYDRINKGDPDYDTDPKRLLERHIAIAQARIESAKETLSRAEDRLAELLAMRDE